MILRPDTIIDLRHRVRRDQDTRRDTIPLEGPPALGNVCRHDIAAACCAAISPVNTELQGVEVLHVATVDQSGAGGESDCVLQRRRGGAAAGGEL